MVKTETSKLNSYPLSSPNVLKSMHDGIHNRDCVFIFCRLKSILAVSNNFSASNFLTKITDFVEPM